MKIKEFFKQNKENIKFILYSIFLIGVIFALGVAFGISFTIGVLQDFGVEIQHEKTNVSYNINKCSYEIEENTRNIVEDYEVIERINYIDDNWEFTSLPFTHNDNWNEYGIKFHLVDEVEGIFSGICYISTYSAEEMGDYWTRIYGLAYFDMATDQIIYMAILDFNLGSTMLGFEILNMTYPIQGWNENPNSWVELIRCVPNIESSYQEGYNEGYQIGLEEGTNSAPTITKNPFLDATYIVYDDSSQIMETDILTSNDFMTNGDTKPHTLWDIMRVNDTQYNRIMFDVENFSTQDGYILKIDNETTSELNFILKIYNAYDYVIYQDSYLLNTSNFEFDFRNINIVDTIGYIELEFINNSIGNYDDTTLGFYNSVITESYNEGYRNGYNNGYIKGDEEGYQEGYDVGFDVGYINGAEDLSIIPNSLVSISQIPINIITSLLNFELLGLNFLDFFKGIFTLLVVVLVIKIFI